MDKITNINVNGTTYDVDIAVEGGYLSEKYDSDLSELAEITSASLNDLNSRVSAIADKVEDVAEGALVNVQSDWNVTDTSSDAYIKNKPTSPIVEGYLHNGVFYAEKPYDNNGYTYVDLGLPSGTKWAAMNIGASSVTDYGNYYQYGKGAAQYAETSGDSNYSGTENPLAASADTAVQVWGGQWHMPTNTQVLELIANTTYEWTRINDVNGGKFTAQNGNYVFFPAAGVYVNGASSGVGNVGLYWSSTPNDNDTAYGWNFVRDGVSNSTSSYDRNSGFSVRGVLDTTAVVYTSAITPEVGKIYIDKDTNVQYRWGDTLFIELHDTGDSSEITATLSGTAGAYALNTTYRVLTGIKLLRNSKGHVIGATFTALNVKDTNSTYSSGTAALITAGTNTSNKTWSAKILADYVKSMVANATRLCGTFNASTGAIDGGSNTLTSVANTKGDLYLCDTAGTYLGTTFEVGDSMFFKNSVAANTAPTDNDVFSVEATVTVSNANANLSWGTTTTIATVEGVDITVTMPDDPLSDNSVYVSGTNVTLEILTQNHYIFLEILSLTITFGSTTSKEVNKFSFEFDSGSTPTTLTLPNGIGYINGSPTIEANAHYYFEIEKSYDGRYFCKYEKYIGGGSFIPIPVTIVSWSGTGTSRTVIMSDNVSQQDVTEHLQIITVYGTAIAYPDQASGIAIKLGATQAGAITSINGNEISISYSGPQITDIQWV